MRLFKTFVVAVSLALPVTLLNGPARAADKFTLDKPHTQIGFSIMRMGLTKIGGWFREFDGEVMFDVDDVAKSSVKATIMTSSIDTGFQRRDDHLRSPAFFNAKEFPEMTFVSTKVEKTGANSGKMTGNLTMLGVTNSVTLDIIFNKMAANPRNNKVYAGFSASGVVDRTAFGMTFLSPGVAPKVMVWIEALTQKK